MNFLALSDFNLVATHGGFGRASRASGQSKATLSRRVRQLEDSLGVRLIERGIRNLKLTEEGAILHARTVMPYNEIASAIEDIKAGLGRPSGRLRVSAPILFGQTTLGSLALAFAAAFPDIMLEVSTEDKLVDLVVDDIDVVIRVNPRPDDNLVGRCFMRNRMVLVAVAELSRPSVCLDGQDAPTVSAVMRTGTADDEVWHVTDPNNGSERRYFPKAVMKFSTLLPIRDAVYAGIGAAMLPYSIVAADLESGRLVNWGNSTTPATELWVLHASRRLVSPKISAFINFVCDYCEEKFPVSMRI